MIDQETFAKWRDWSKRDDAWKLFVPSDIRQMLGEIERLRAALEEMADPMNDFTDIMEIKRTALGAEG